ncbi:hypothetical protein X801_02514 [Opisthorchis viverrini]|uniref:Uncharacterized protein n=2 Tax=Opisthorchis viverrini TaxID=6198 RepID=A0A1S8X4J3_OPIVI|nr:hypothetical protein X801_02514 [Opisthorchis viverrini]
MDGDSDPLIINAVTMSKPDYLIQDPLSADHQRPHTNSPKSPKKRHKETQMGFPGDENNSKPSGSASKPFDLSENDVRMLHRRTYLHGMGAYGDPDFMGPPGSPFDLSNWDWLRLDALGPGWEQAMRDVPVNRGEALNLLIVMKKKLLRAASELTFYKERVALLQEQLIYQKRNEEKFIKLRAHYKAQLEEVEKLRAKAAKVPGLEKTVRQQEELITRLESFLDRQRSRNVNENFNKRAPDTDPYDVNLLDHLPPTPTPLPETSDAVAATALRNLSSENENLRQTVAELSRTVRNLAQQQQDDHERQRELEDRHREELQSIREQQNRLAEQQFTQNKQMDYVEKQNLRNAVSENEKTELYRMLEAADYRIRNLEDELASRAPRSRIPYSEGTQNPNRPYVYREPPWRNPGQEKPGNRLPPVINQRDKHQNRRFPQEYVRAHASDSGLEQQRRQLQMQPNARRYDSTILDDDWLGDLVTDDF